MAAIHDVFHVSQLRKCIKVPTEILKSQDIEIESDLSYAEYPIKVLEILKPQDIEIESDLSYAEYPIKVLDTKERDTRREKVKIYKI